RASVWQLLDNGRRLHCEDAYEHDNASHIAGMEITRAELPQLFAALQLGEEIQVLDAAGDRRTAELHRILMHNLHSRGVCVLPVRFADKTVGVVILEDANQVAEAHEFILLVASMLALRMGEGSDVSTEASAVLAGAAPTSSGERNSASDLVLQGLDATNI